MNLYKIKISSKAEKQLNKLSIDEIKLIKESVNKLENNPRPIYSKKLKNRNEIYRLKIKKFRVLYSIHKNILIIHVLKILKRKEAYSKKHK